MPGIRSSSAVSLKRGTSLRTLTICFLILYAAIPARLLAQATDCNDPSVSPEANAVATLTMVVPFALVISSTILCERLRFQRAAPNAMAGLRKLRDAVIKDPCPG
jgi:hypothetical protein